ncbi:hypothetical protein BDF19DRAFT_454287 [Syncephalis fuscata]|nr:hypothetical protein BDF19DRAFT_454287 [Syncephalis fuscata]
MASTAPNAAATGTQSTSPTAEAYEIGWMFVQQYYTFLNKEPSRLHCFYNKKSKMIHGHEGEPVNTYKGQKEIHDKIIELGFDDCHVLVSNVDSVASLDGGIIIQVLGEMCNKEGPSQKFAQTFFLAEQPNGYFVLNDIFRFLKDDVGAEYELSDESAVTLNVAAPVEETVAAIEPVEVVASPAPAPVEVAVVEAPVAEPVVAVPAKKPESAPRAAAAPEQTKPNGVKSTTPAVQPEAVIDSGKAAVNRASSAPAAPATTAKVETPTASTPQSTVKSWANLAAVNSTRWGTQASEIRGTSVVMPANKGTGSTAAASTASSTTAPTTTTTAATTSAGNAQPTSTPPPHAHGGPRNRFPSRDEAAVVYVKGISERINTDTLKTFLTESIGPVKTIDHISAKNCAFVEFANVELAKTAITRNSFELRGTSFTIEERRRFTPTGGRGRGGFRGGFDRREGGHSGGFDRNTSGGFGSGRGGGRGGRGGRGGHGGHGGRPLDK